MKENFYIFSSGRLKRKENTLFFKKQDETKVVIPIENTEAIYVFGELDMNTKILNYLTQKQITVHIFNYYGFYAGSYCPREYLNSGQLLVKQVQHYLNKKQRMFLAKEFILSGTYNILKNMKYYSKRERDLDLEITEIENLREKIQNTETIPELMGIEGNIRIIYYRTWHKIIDREIEFEKRVKRPPDNMINTLISYLNSIVYTSCLSEIYRTQLNPLISYLHEPGEKRFSLSLDIAEIFKPIFTDRLIFTVMNKNQIKDEHFLKESEFCYLKEKGRAIITKEFDEKMKVTIKHKTLDKYVSYRRLIRLECYKLIKHIVGDEEYEGFKIWW